MFLRNQILQEHTKANCQKIIDWVGDDISKFKQLFHLFPNDEYCVKQRAAWPLSYCAIAHPEFMQNNFAKLISNLQKPSLHDSVKRNTLRLLQHIDIPERYEGEIMDTCFKYVESPTEAVAIKAFALTVLGKLSRKYPEIIPEIKIIIEDQLTHQTAGFKSRANKLLQQFI